MLDNILYGFQTSLNVFTGANGLEFLVSRIKMEIDACIDIGEDLKDYELEPTFIMDPGSSNVYQTLLSHMPILRSIMKLVLHLMQTHGSADGMRNLIDSSLPHSLLKIFNFSKLFSHVGVFGLSINIMSTFIHNEPTTLAILQEMGVISSFLVSARNELSISAEVNII